MSAVAAIDCGTNSIRLLIAEPDGDGLRDLERQMRIVRLGQGVDARGEFAPEALARTFAAVDEYAALIQQHNVQRVRFVATSATRDAGNRQLFIDGIQARLGVLPDVVPGTEEAALSFAGAASVLADLAEDPVLVVDLGGGSTEFVVGNRHGVSAAKSVDMGCVRFTERYLRSDPPTAAEVSAARDEAERIIASVAVEVPLASVSRVIGVAGTVTTVTAHALELPRYLPAAIHGAVVSLDRLEAAADSLLGMDRQSRAELPYMHPGRVDVIGAGSLLWRTILLELNRLSGGRITQATTSEHDILDGIALGIR